MEEKKSYSRGHVLLLPFASQGHINPMLQFAKRLVSKNTKATLAITNFISKTIEPKLEIVGFGFDTISDGYDEGGIKKADDLETYLKSLQTIGSQTLAQLIKKQESLGHPIDCIVYDSILPWALDVAKEFGIVGASFFTQSCIVNYIYYAAYDGSLTLPISSSVPFSVPGLPMPLHLHDMPSFISVYGSYPAYLELILNQYCNVEKADFVLFNTFYKLEDETVDAISKIMSSNKLLTIGPTLPSSYLDNRVQNDKNYGLDLFQSDPSFSANWLSTRPNGTVVYISFGSMASPNEEQMEEIAWGLKRSNCNFLWVVRSSSEEEKLPKEFLQEISGKGLIVRWSPQLEILSNEAVGCFISHGGWNSTLEALSLGVPIVVMPHWTDQTTNAKLLQDFWKVGIRVKVDDEISGLVRREEIERCINEVFNGDKGMEMKKNALKWKELAKEAVSEGGTSDNNIEALLSQLTKS